MKTVVWCLPAIAIAWEGHAYADEPTKPQSTTAPTAPAAPRVLSAKPVPVARIGSATWDPTFGLVAEQSKPGEGGDAAAGKDEPASKAVPSIASTSLTEFGLRIFAGFDQRTGADSVDPVVGAALRYEARHVDSLLAPWAEGGFSAAISDATPANESDDENAINWDIWLRGGLDVHPLRQHWIGVGPFLGYRQLHTRALLTSAIVQGVDVGGQVHFRTKESAGNPPVFDAIAYGFVQGAGLADGSNRGFLGALLSAGADFRAYAQLEGCAASPDSCFPRQVRAVGGFGGVF